jgi:hypothetical protein
MTEREITAALLTANADRCDPPLFETEVRRIAASIAHYAPSVRFTELPKPLPAVEIHR